MLFWTDFNLLRNCLKSGRNDLTKSILQRLFAQATASRRFEEARIAILAKYAKYYKIDRPRLFIDAQHGLCNRLRAIASASSIAQATGHELVIVWEPDFHCNCKFGDLFDNEFQVIDKSFLEQAKRDSAVIFNYMEIEDGANRDAEIAVPDGTDAYIRSAYHLVSRHADSRRANTFLRQLTPTAEVLALVNSLSVSDHLGIHIRMEAGQGLDHNIYDSPKNWPKYGHDALHFWRAKSHFSHFEKKLDQLIAQNNSLRLFLATDRHETYQIFHARYGNRLSFLERNVYDRSKQQIVYALADLILLSRCRALLGSTYSSFSELVPRMAKRAISVEWSGKDF